MRSEKWEATQPYENSFPHDRKINTQHITYIFGTLQQHSCLAWEKAHSIQRISPVNNNIDFSEKTKQLSSEKQEQDKYLRRDRGRSSSAGILSFAVSTVASISRRDSSKHFVRVWPFLVPSLEFSGPVSRSVPVWTDSERPFMVYQVWGVVAAGPDWDQNNARLQYGGKIVLSL